VRIANIVHLALLQPIGDLHHYTTACVLQVNTVTYLYKYLRYLTVHCMYFTESVILHFDLRKK
jgi:hypothetical protein